ncbi:MAG: GH1 / GH5_19 [uncultured Thermomicrobiales bacterium]|uniref:Beta-glucosidase n=1 Tax=uncultured Thermomicrobiales bacterium TaxID=1645740 RepID=A0A6J4VE23_9BACT|nr:MAG: GH1 / GH5_19 [uncultured Thermomicrobiales bacterium]
MSEATDGAFPDGFTWGVATSSYQIEGAVREDGRGESIWDRFSHTPGRTVNGETGDIACDHYHRYRDDVALMRELNLGAYRFSVSWPRVLPDGRGRVNEAGLDFYDRLVDELLAAGIKPWVTLYCWDLPQALEDQGGWPGRSTVDAFTELVEAVTRRLGDRVRDYITVNEPFIMAYLGYGLGLHAPGRRDMTDALAAGHHALLAHGRALEVVRANVPGARAGITLSLAPTYPLDADREADHEAARRDDVLFNRWFLDPLFGRGYPDDLARITGGTMPQIRDGDLALIAAPGDFLGVNYYTPTYSSADPAISDSLPHPDPGVERTALNWPVEPGALTDLLARIQRDYAPRSILIAENGAAFDGDRVIDGRVADPRRTAYLAGHLRAVHDAIAVGSPVEGYFAWSALDNFEWAEGYGKRFGIVHVDYETQGRTIKDSGRYLARVATSNRLD